MFYDPGGRPGLTISSFILWVPRGQRPAHSASYLCIVGAQWMPEVELSYIWCKILQVPHPQLKGSVLLQTPSSLCIWNVCLLTLLSCMSPCFLSFLSIPLWLHYPCITMPSKSFSNLFYFFNWVLRVWQVPVVTLVNPSSNKASSFMLSLSHDYPVSPERWLLRAGWLPSKATCFIFNMLSFLQGSFSDLLRISNNKDLLTTYCSPDTTLGTGDTEMKAPCSYPLMADSRVDYLLVRLLSSKYIRDSNFSIWEWLFYSFEVMFLKIWSLDHWNENHHLECLFDCNFLVSSWD